MELIRNFKKISKSDVALAGGKGASLGEMTQAGIPVPPGFVVLSSAFDQFIEDADLIQEIEAILDKVDHKEIHTVENASEQIQGLIKNAIMPESIAEEIKKQFKNLNTEYVAVRSSATAEDGQEHAWAGQLDSFLNTTKKDLLEKVKHCWASLFTPRAIFYRFEKGLHTTQISVAVVVQKMVNSEISGIAFSVHPVTEDRNQLIIEAGFGLGEAIVSGQITPDSYVVKKEPRRIIDLNVNTQSRALYRINGGDPPLSETTAREPNEWQTIPEPKASSQVLSEAQILELSNIILGIEKHYGFPCDIEWAFENKKFYIVQSRPITTLEDKQSPESNHIIMSKVYSREKTLFYFSMWNDSDKRGWKNFLNHDIRHNIFLVPPGKKGSVWYSQRELDDIDGLLKKKLNTEPEIIFKFIKTLDKNWEILFPYLSDSKRIESVDEFRNYYDRLVDWWSAMNTAFTIPDMNDVGEDMKKKFLTYRVESEKYTEKMNKVMVAFWKEHFPEFSEYTFCVAPSEVEKISNDPSRISELENRKNGFFMLDEKIYPMQELNSSLKENNLSLEEVSTEGVEEIKGAPAYQGRIQGQVRKILLFGDMDKFRNGEILVTEMTNPDYLPIMKIASAIITDEGGTTCHAAIASRELKIPCVVGTKIATHFLQDGDIVDVDATNGVVKIIERAEGQSEPITTLSPKAESLNKAESDLLYAGNAWFMTITRNMSFWHQCLSNEGHFHHTKDFGMGAKLQILHITKEGTETSLFMHNPNYTEYSKAIINAISTGKAIANLKKKYFELAEKLISSLDNAKQNLNKSSLAIFLNEYRRFAAGLMITATIGRSGAEKLTARLEELGYKGEEISEINAAVTYPKEHTPLFDSQIGLLKVGILVQDGKPKEKIDEALWKWLQKHGYIPVNFCEDSWTISDARKQLDDFLKKNCKEEYRLAEKSHSERVERAKHLLDKIGDKEVSILAHAIAEGTYLNEFRKNAFSKISLEYRGIFEKIALMGGSKNWRDCFYLTPSEMLDIISDKSVSILDFVEERRVAGVCVNEKGESVFLDKEITNKFYDYIAKAHSVAHERSSMDQIIKGSSANKGVVGGIVKIILSSKDFHKLSVGEILVTTMTSVDFVPVMARAAAFVTNEGGITSHASIVAREMGKPCIIGTKNATQILKDGDLVEVDANNGVIKIIEKVK